ncbi:MAG TPA: alpha/beta hydrolase [bacterium]|nr:alpha/beta hydrolase [bacterium]
MTTPVYKQYDQMQLDAQYKLRTRHPDFQTFFDAYERDSERVRGALEHRADVPYGDSPLQRLDVFPARRPGSPVQVFIHGGYWQGMDKRFFGYPAEPLVAAGAAFVSVNYDLAPAVSVDQIVAQCRAAVAWCHANAASFNGDPERLYVSGHSAGGHLTLMLVLGDWAPEQGEPQRIIRGACAISGVFDLEPIRLCYLNEALGLDGEAARRNSPLFHLGRHGPPLVAAVGHEETEEFRRQNGMLATAWRARGLDCEELTLPGRHHFDIVQELGRAESPLTRAMLAQMGL